MSLPVPTTAPPTRRWWWFAPEHGPSTGLVACLGLVAAGACALISPRASENGPVVCPSRLFFGLPCPGCGMVRACVHLAHGDLAGMWHYNPFALVVAAVWAGIVVLVASRWWRHQPMRNLDGLPGGRLLLPVGLVWGAWGIARMVLTATGRWPSIL